ncbi:hypothetical protein D3C81_2013280 [compost metagenome]
MLNSALSRIDASSWALRAVAMAKVAGSAPTEERIIKSRWDTRLKLALISAVMAASTWPLASNEVE